MVGPVNRISDAIRDVDRLVETGLFDAEVGATEARIMPGRDFILVQGLSEFLCVVSASANYGKPVNRTADPPGNCRTYQRIHRRSSAH